MNNNNDTISLSARNIASHFRCLSEYTDHRMSMFMQFFVVYEIYLSV